MNRRDLPIAVIGAGPVGLAAAAHLIQRGERPVLFEAGNEIGANIRGWGHVHLFSPWRWCVDRAAVTLLEETGWTMPDAEKLPTGHELIDEYLVPLAQLPALQGQIHLNSRVLAISRRRIDKMKDHGRTDAPFVIQVEREEGEERFLARAVIDASGTWATANPIGADGLPAPGERALQNKIAYGIPDVLGTNRERYVGKRIAVVGGGHSAINAILELSDLTEQEPATHITWILRKANVAATYGGLHNDELPGRGLLGMRIKELVEAGSIEVVTPFFTTRIEQNGEQNGEQVQLFGDTPMGERVVAVDEIIGATGARPDLGFLRELRLDLHPGVEAPTAIAGLIDPNIHSCGSVPPHGERELRHPETDFYMVGMKSYGRAPTFLLATGYEQVRSVVAALTGDWEAAADVQLELPETGVCGVPAAVDANAVGAGNACCGTAASAATTPLINVDLAGLKLARETTGGETLALHDESCCGVEACCTDDAPVAADACCTSETKAAAKTVSAHAGTDGCCP